MNVLDYAGSLVLVASGTRRLFVGELPNESDHTYNQTYNKGPEGALQQQSDWLCDVKFNSITIAISL
jgi:hypothetical protein